MPLSAFQLGKLKIAAHVREELDRAGIEAESIRCKSGGTHTRGDTARIIITIAGVSSQMDLSAQAVEGCECIVAGETWHEIAAFIQRLERSLPNDSPGRHEAFSHRNGEPAHLDDGPPRPDDEPPS